jgi:hypothetical protein
MGFVLNTIKKKNYLMAWVIDYQIHRFLIPKEDPFQNNILYIDNIVLEKMVKYIK